MTKILLLNGPNLNLLGSREKDIYGDSTLEEIENRLSSQAAENGLNLICFQSNAEHELVDKIQEAKKSNVKIILFNPGAFTHTSVALRDAILGVNIPMIEIHISNIFGRESFREKSFFSDISLGVISGLGEESYTCALDFAIKRIGDL